MLRVIADHVDHWLSRWSLGRLLRDQQVVVQTTVEGCDVPFARTIVLWSGDATTQICGRRCPTAADCRCGLTANLEEWPARLCQHQAKVDAEAVSAFRRARRWSQGISLWLPAVVGFAASVPVALSGDMAMAALWLLVIPVALSTLFGLVLRITGRWLFRRAVSLGQSPPAPSTPGP